jgi:hypothetical protein
MNRIGNIVLGLILGLVGLFASVCAGQVMYGELFVQRWGLWIFALPFLAIGILMLVLASRCFRKAMTQGRHDPPA